ncbi:zinc finger protein 3-like, partial [Amblyraja radiata]|uniref:zinc finger protein 3-like n=1 Tax=Amblyraja radiata TaxID=386614 RepID=UPI0014034F49
EQPFICSDCGKCFKSSTTQTVHGCLHTGNRSYTCSDWGKGCTRSSSLLVYQRHHAGERPYTCAQCAKCFTQSFTLLSHQRVHACDHPVPSLECGEHFAMASHAMSHQHLPQEVQRLCFNCSGCYKSCTRYDRLLRHNCGLSGERPFVRADCGKCFAPRMS